MAKDHRRELVGLYAHLWFARCLVLRDTEKDNEEALSIFKRLESFDDPALVPFQREVFSVRMLRRGVRKEYSQLIDEARSWLDKNKEFRSELAYLGVQFELGKALVERALTENDADRRASDSRAARELLEKLTERPNPYQNLARKQKERIP